MKRGIFLFLIFLVILSGCKEETRYDYLTNEKVLTYFEEVERICNEDNGKLWGENLYGPIMIVNPLSRRIYSNIADDEGLLKLKDGIYSGSFPKERMIETYAMHYGNTLFAMVEARDEERMIQGCIHALFHCFQLENDIHTPRSNVRHMNERTARLWIKMEWKAMEKAIRSSEEARTQALRDALVFRAARREMYSNHITDENYFENYEGLATFTYTYLCNTDDRTRTRKILENLHSKYSDRSFRGGYGFIAGALYAYLLNEIGFDFSTINDKSIDLGKLAQEQYGIELPEICRDIAGSLALNYDVDIVRNEEREREEEIAEGLRKRTAPYMEKPIVVLELESPNFSYESQDAHPVDSLGTIYQTIRVSDNWGKLAVDDGGCLVSPDMKFLKVQARDVESDKQHITGEGWHIVLSSNWELVKVEENYFIRKLVP